MSSSKKVYLITFHGSVNYGAVLQSYALYKKVTDLGFNCEVIDYNRKKHHKNFLKISWKVMPITLIREIMCFPRKYIMHTKFNGFSTKKMHLTAKSFNGHNALFKNEFNPNDVFLVGSDQVWNTRVTDENYHYFLDFISTKNKFSYASSFGVSSIDDWSDRDYIIELLSMFSRISVREETGQLIINKYLDKQVSVVCDPTFLLTPKGWNSITKRQEKNDYILLFMLSYNKKLIDYALSFAERYNCQIINMAYTVKKIKGAMNNYCVSPEKFLGLIQNAKYVFTNSFHGFALSLNFNKQVYVALSGIGRNSRIVDLAERYGVSDRIIDDSFDINSLIPIDYDKVNCNIEKDRQKSIRFLEEILHAATD